MDIAHGISHTSQDLGLLLRQLPTLALGAVSTVVSAAAAHQEVGLVSVRDIRLKGATSQVFKLFQHAVWLVGVEHVDALQAQGERG